MELLGYLDPAAISVLATSLTAAFVAIAASLVIYWRKIKKKFNKNSDPDKNKDAEQDIRVIDESALNDDSTATPVASDEPQPVETGDSQQGDSTEKTDEEKE